MEPINCGIAHILEILRTILLSVPLEWKKGSASETL